MKQEHFVKMFQVGKNQEEQPCGGCNWKVARVFLMAHSQKDADKIYKLSGREDGEPRGLCGDCMTGLLVDGAYLIKAPGGEKKHEKTNSR